MLHVDCSVRVLFKPNSLLSVGLELHSLSLATPVSGWGLKCNKVKRVVGILIFKIFFLNCTFATAAAVRLSVWCSTIWPSTGYLPSPLPLAWSQRAQLHHSLRVVVALAIPYWVGHSCVMSPRISVLIIHTTRRRRVLEQSPISNPSRLVG